jgi:hypothetical protein
MTTFNTIGELADAAISATDRNVNKQSIAAFEGMVRQALRTDGRTGLCLGNFMTELTVTADVFFYGNTFTVVFNKSNWRYSITNITAA